jgi:hypothetical protein
VREEGKEGREEEGREGGKRENKGKSCVLFMMQNVFKQLKCLEVVSRIVGSEPYMTFQVI